MPLQKIDSIDLSKYIIAKNGDMIHLKLQKLLYYIEAYHLAYFEESIIEDNFEAWLHGPVSRKVWDYYKPIANIYDDIVIDKDELALTQKKVEDILSDEQKEFIDDVLLEYGIHTAYYLECLTHNELPWQYARRNCDIADKCEEPIDKNIMKDFYRKLIYQNGQNSQS